MRALLKDIEAVPPLTRFGRVSRIEGLAVEVSGALGAVRLGGQVHLSVGINKTISCEVVGFRDGRALVMPLGALEGISLGARADFEDRPAAIRPSSAWLGRVVDGFGNAMDGKGPLPQGPQSYPLKAPPPLATRRARVGGKLDMGVRAMNAFTTLCKGQRMGIFAGSGVGKSTLMAMLARNTNADAIVIGLIGERGREVQEFLQEDLREEGLARSIVVVATSDEPALMRKQAAFLTLALAEKFRDDGADVLCMIDSVTRFAMAQREIGLAAGEPPTTKGYTPTVFTELPRLLERAGPGTGQGSITGLFTVLVDGDDHNEPVADAVRGILDGHIVMERGIAERGRYPAVNVLKSVSRTMPRSCDPAFWPVVQKARAVLATYSDMEELIRLGAYRAGSSAEVDEAIRLQPLIDAFLRQGKEEATSLSDGYHRLAEIMASV